MKQFKNLLFLLIVLIIPFSIFIRTLDINGGSFFMTLAFFFLFIYFSTKAVISFRKNEDSIVVFLQTMLALMTFALYTRYLFFIFGDIPTLVIVPLFVFSAFSYLLKSEKKHFKLSAVSILYLILTIPLFGLEFHRAPRKYIPQNWYDGYNVSNTVQTSFETAYNNPVTKFLMDSAADLRNNNDYQKSIEVFKDALKKEPNNAVIYLELAESYAKSNKLKYALTLLDTAISIDTSLLEAFNNRGLINYKLKRFDQAIEDLKKCIEINPTVAVCHSNLALVYYQKKYYRLACEQIEYAETLGFDIDSDRTVERIKKNHCQ